MSLELAAQIRKYESIKSKLELDHFGKWILMYDENPVGFFESAEEAIQEAATKFGKGPYLIRQIGVTPPLPSPSLLFRPMYADC